ncbi:cyclase family protein [Brevibacillus borstelensis]|uniref:cyclase family protein n=1 Tax=Brevibacillus borstelensis TaxID=45462 RepID=UPI000468025C|nr:cyclase family protein [Brevibacillus borstelensis]KKX55453.1 metal-dependent hydrolase [Brevibacillus borstelensis cifa_chp40]MCC0563581.1 cyclase family protein [Brevibacillus borstelensis]MCM3469224.1 cyclase family protein [Brevibacillus borstelensis]MCM3589744.1 cyclase family protein [Brevibacillus borstelensis]MCM3621980.1 cyclase family protein [Brevibacillus borstelensis]
MRIIDLSQVLESGMPQYPGQQVAEFKQVSQVESDGFQVTDFHAVVHVGTHCDAPAHFIQNGETIEAIPLERFVGEAVIVDVHLDGQREMSPAVLEGADIRPGDIVLFRTGLSKQWGTDAYETDYPYFGEELAKELVERGVRAVGLDFISPDPIETENFPAHHIFLGNKLGIVENLKNLEQIDRKRVFFAAAPLKIKGSDGAFTRAFAVLFD